MVLLIRKLHVTVTKTAKVTRICFKKFIKNVLYVAHILSLLHTLVERHIRHTQHQKGKANLFSLQDYVAEIYCICFR